MKKNFLLYNLITFFSMILSFLHYTLFVLMTEGRLAKYHLTNMVHLFDFTGKTFAIIIIIFMMITIVRSTEYQILKVIQAGYLFCVVVAIFTGFIHWLVAGHSSTFSESVDRQILTIRGMSSYVLIFIPAYIFTFFINSYFVKKNNNEGVEIAPNFSEEKDGD